MENKNPKGASYYDLRRDYSASTPWASTNEMHEQGRQLLDLYRAAFRSELFATEMGARTGTAGIFLEGETKEGFTENVWSTNLDRLLPFFLPKSSTAVAAQGKAIIAESDAEIDQVASGREAAYAKLAIARGKYFYSARPKIYKSPESGVVLQTSNEKGTLNLIFEGEQAYLIRTTDDFTVQVNCSLNPISINELLDIYEDELTRLED